MTYSACIPCLFHHKATQSNDPNTTQTYSVYIPLLLCVALWWNRHGIHAEYVIQSIANSHGILYVYPLVVMINSRPIPDLFTPGIFTPSRRASASCTLPRCTHLSSPQISSTACSTTRPFSHSSADRNLLDKGPTYSFSLSPMTISSSLFPPRPRTLSLHRPSRPHLE